MHKLGYVLIALAGSLILLPLMFTFGAIQTMMIVGESLFIAALIVCGTVWATGGELADLWS